MVDRQKTLVEFVVAWADYEKRMSGIGSEARKFAEGDAALQQMVSRVTDELMRSPDVQREIAMQLAIAEFSR
ncbi:MAG TPA: hypothetical protein VFG07_09415 [Thermoplasmata archaeon]|nr:hypothetical protein [Thermoplasmata archaeon]